MAQIRSGTDLETPPSGICPGDQAVPVCVVIPTLNEAPSTLPDVFGRPPGERRQVIVIDGLSADGTVEVAQSPRPDARMDAESRPRSL